MQLSSLDPLFTAEKERFVSELSEFLRIPSISTDPAHNDDCVRCATWLSDHLRHIGLHSELLPTSTKPVVFASFEVGSHAPTVLFYGHYDVQPVDPIERWSSPPFEPSVRGSRIYARGAQDNKGQLFYVVKAIEALVRAKALRCNIKLLIEGEEESGSAGITERAPSWRDRLKASVLMVCDTGTLRAGVPAVTMGLRGIAHMTVSVRGPKHDLHSGVHGGVIRNPATELTRLIASLHHDDGSIAVEGFYDGIQEPSVEDRALANEFPLTSEQYCALVGVAPEGGERRFTPWERRGFRPTIEVNGIHGGYGGPGGKTIIPAEAFAKISTRLVAGQDPARCLTLLEQHLRDRTPKGVALEITENHVGGPGVRLSSQSPLVRHASQVLQEISGVKPLFIWEGASIPIVAGLSTLSGGEPLLVGFGLEEDNIHAPDESFDIAQFKSGFLYAARFLASYGG